MKNRIGIVTNDLKNQDKYELFLSLSQECNISLITTSSELGLYSNISKIYNISTERLFKDKIGSLIYLFSSICNSITDTQFPKRNLYRKNRFIVNQLHFIKLALSRINLLPSYSKFIETLYKNDLRNEKVLAECDIFIFDSLLINVEDFHSLLGRVSSMNSKILIADVYSWDNVHYSSMTYFADYYFLWNKELKSRLIHDHPALIQKEFRYTGVQYMNYLTSLKPNKKYCTDYILYAAVFCDDILGECEILLVLDLADKIRRALPNIKLYFRPYPSVDRSFYYRLYDHPGIEVKEYGVHSRRYENNSEVIRTECNKQEKMDLIYNAKAFISTGSTFTLEAAYLSTPIIQLDLEDGEGYQSKIFERLHISDHIIKTLFLYEYPNVVRSTSELLFALEGILNERTKENYLQYGARLKEFVNLKKKPDNRERYIRILKDIAGDGT